MSRELTGGQRRSSACGSPSSFDGWYSAENVENVRVELEAVEAAASEQEQLIAADVARGTELAGEPVALAQQPPLRVAAAVGGTREFGGDQGEAGDVGRQLFHLVGREQHYPQAAGVAGPPVALGRPAGERNDEAGYRGGIDRLLEFGQILPVVSDDITVTQQPARHRPSP